MTVVAIKCASCGVKFGTIDNLWLKLGNDRISLITHANTRLKDTLDVSGVNSDLRLELSLSKHAREGQSGTVVAQT